MQTRSVFIILVAVCASSSYTAVKFAVTAAPSTTSSTPGLFAQAQAGSQRISADNSVLLLLDHQVRHAMS
jgi:hypothetical protein